MTQTNKNKEKSICCGAKPTICNDSKGQFECCDKCCGTFYPAEPIKENIISADKGECKHPPTEGLTGMKPCEKCGLIGRWSKEPKKLPSEIELLNQLMEIVHQRKIVWYKEALTDVFKNGRFWEAQEIWEILKDYLDEQSRLSTKI